MNETSAANTTATGTTTIAGTTIEDPEIPQTGETNQSVLIGAILLALAASLFYILRRRQRQN